MNIIRLQGDVERKNGIYYEYDADLKPLGEGGMGRVYKGYRVVERTGERIAVAIKAAYDGIPDRVVERARREASIQFDNENLVRMYGFVETVNVDAAGNRKVNYYMIMELLIGVTLEDLMFGIVTDQYGKQIPFASELYNQYQQNRNVAVVRIMKAILSGLMTLHDNGYIHRDVDPSNVMITAEGKIKLIDFGICKQLVSLESKDKSLTSSGEFIGKVNYAAPELVLGDVRSQDYTTDIYALGVILYQLCAGHLPFNGTDQEILAANLHKPLPLTDVKGLELKRIIRKSTEKSQSKRYATVSEMRVDIERVISNNNNILSVLQNKKVKMITIGSIAAMLIIICVFSLSKKDPEEENIVILPIEELVIDSVPKPIIEIVKQPTSQEIYAEAMKLLSYDDSVALGEKGKEKLRVLVEDSLFEPAKMDYYMLLINSYNPMEVKKGYYGLEEMATNDTTNKVAMFECGLTLSKGNISFNTPTLRQSCIGIEPDLLRANEYFHRCAELDTFDYKSVYWVFNNLMEIKLGSSLSSKENKKIDKEIMKLYREFDYRVAYHEDSISDMYRNAISKDKMTLKNWGLIK